MASLWFQSETNPLVNKQLQTLRKSTEPNIVAVIVSTVHVATVIRTCWHVFFCGWQVANVCGGHAVSFESVIQGLATLLHKKDVLRMDQDVANFSWRRNN